jgi:hypothetical protein
MRFFILTICLIAGSLIGLKAQTYQAKNWWQVNGDVQSIVEDTINHKVYIGGGFNYIFKQDEPNGTQIDLNTGIPDYHFANPINNLYDVVADGQGGWFVAGPFSSIGGVARSYLAQIDSTGNVTSWNPNPNATVYDIELVGNNVIAAGDFYTVGGQTRPKLAAINRYTGLANSWAPAPTGTNAACYSLKLHNDTLYVGGTFTTISGLTRNDAAAYTVSNFSILPFDLNNISQDYTSNFVIKGDKIFFISKYFGAFSLKVANVSTGTVLPWNSSMDSGSGSAYDIEIYNNELFVAGYFTTIANQVRNGFAIFDVNTLSLLPVDSSFHLTTVDRMTIIGDTLIAMGNFSSIMGQQRSKFALIDMSSKTLLPFKCDFEGGNTSCAAIYNNKVYVGGSFTRPAVLYRNIFVELNALTGEPTDWFPKIRIGSSTGQIYSMLLFNNKLFIAGEYTSIDSIPRNNLASFDLSSLTLTSFNPDVDYYVKSLASRNDTLYAGGDFQSVSSQTRNRLAAFNLNNGSLLSWAPSSNGVIMDFEFDGPKIYLGGIFNNINGQFQSGVAAVDLSGNVLPLNTSLANIGDVMAIELVGNIFYVGGWFTSFGGLTRKNLAAYNTSTGTVTSWNPNANGRVSSMEVRNNIIYIGGQFTTIGGVSRNLFASVNTTGNLNAWNPNMQWLPGSGSVYPDVNNIVITDSTLYIGGVFNTVGGEKKASFLPFGWSCTSAPPATITNSANTYCQSNPITLSIDTSSLYNSGYWQWYADSCGGTALASGPNITVTPAVNTTYFVRGEGGCANIGNCASITINAGQPNTYSFNQTACGNYTWNTNTYTNSGIYSESYTNALGCDSTVTLNLTIENVNTIVTQTSGTLTAGLTGGNYQWLDCINGFVSLLNDTNQSFTPAVSGDYAVAITSNGCVDTSSCINVFVVGVPIKNTGSIRIAPNPAKDQITIENYPANAVFILYDLQGKMVLSQSINTNTLILETLNKGLYFYMITDANGAMITKGKLVKE